MSNKIYEANYLDFYHPDKCTGDLGEKWCNFKWRIENIRLNPQETYQSPVFSTRLLPNEHWYLEVKLSAPGELNIIYISLRRLQSAENSVSVVDVIYKFICDGGNRREISDKRRYEYSNETYLVDKYRYNASFWESEIDYVIVECKLRPNKEMIKDVKHCDLDETLPVNLRTLLLSGALYDTIIKVENEEFRAHFVILCARLRNMLPISIPTEIGKRIIKIDNLPAFVVKEMLKYAYTGQACVDLVSVLPYKHILVEYSSDFFQRCCWEDNPFAETFFSYETDSIEWNLKDVSKVSRLGLNGIELLRLYPKELKFSLAVLGAEEEDKGLTLSFKYRGEEMPKPTIVSCSSYLLNVESNETFKLGVTETLLQSNRTKGKLRLCSLAEVMIGATDLRAREGALTLKTDLKIGYGSSRSSIKDLYMGQFDISKCTSCASLCADMENLHRNVAFTDIYVKCGDGQTLSAHRAILIARWSEAEKHNVKENYHIVMRDYNYGDLCKLFRQIYSGKESK